MKPRVLLKLIKINKITGSEKLNEWINERGFYTKFISGNVKTELMKINKQKWKYWLKANEWNQQM